MALLLMPYTNLHELNLDWIINALKESGVLSVNGETGIVVLYKEANIQLPDIPTDLNWSIKRKTNGTNVGIKFNKAGPLQRVYGNSEFAVYDTGNPPPYPVASVNGQTGAVVVPVAFDSMSGDLLNISTVSPEHSWTLNRKTRDGDIALTLDSTNDNPTVSLDYINNTESVDVSLPLMKYSDIGYVDVTVPLGTAVGAYKVGTFASLGIPYGSALLSAQCININSSVGVITGVATYVNDIYVYAAEEVSVADATVRITYKK